MKHKHSFRYRKLCFEPLGQRVLLHGSPVTSDDPSDMETIVRMDHDSGVPHANNHVKQAEHLAVFDLVPHEEATHRAVTSGDWSDAGTWQDGVLPVDGAHVLIEQGVTVVVDTEVSDRLHTLRIDGTLQFAPNANTGLNVDTMVVDADGILEIGTESTPIQDGVRARIVFTDDGPIDTVWDPKLLSRGLVSHGTARIHGAQKTSHVSVSEYPRAGNNYLLLDSITGWKAGDRVLVPSVDRDVPDEVMTIQSIDGNTAWLTEVLQHDHMPPRDTLDLRVANLDRNVIFESENKTDPQRAGHVMFMHSSDVSVKYASFQHIGRNDKSRPTTDPETDENGKLVPGTGDNPRGRYAVHFHRIGPGSQPAVVEGSVVEHNPGWGFVNHDGHVIFRDNVSFDVKGAGFVTEVGSERGAFIDNMAVRSEDSRAYFPTLNASKEGSGTGFGSVGHGFWIQGSSVDVEGNTASGHAQEGIFFNGLNQGKVRPERGVFDTRFLKPGTLVGAGRQFDGGINTSAVPYGRIKNNAVFASGLGLGLWSHPRQPAVESGAFGDVIDGLDIWNVKWHGIRMGYNWGTILRNVLVLGDGETSIANGWETPKGITGNVGTRDIKLENVEVRNFAVGIVANPFNNTIIENAILANVVDIHIGVHATGFGYRNVFIHNAQHEPFSDRVYKVRFADDFAGHDTHWDYRGPNNVYYNGKKLFWYKQAAGGVPFPSSQVPSWFEAEPFSQYIDKTQRQLQNRFGFVFAGEMAPRNARDGAADQINGWILDSVAVPAIERYTFETEVLSAPEGTPTVVRGESRELEFVIRSESLPDDPLWRVYAISGSRVEALQTLVDPLEDGLWSITAVVAPTDDLDVGRYSVILSPRLSHDYAPFRAVGMYLSELEIISHPTNRQAPDVNLDGEFNASDLILVLRAGKYETDQPASLTEGDWNGDGVFDSLDLVSALADGGYEREPLPESTGLLTPGDSTHLAAAVDATLRVSLLAEDEENENLW